MYRNTHLAFLIACSLVALFATIGCNVLEEDEVSCDPIPRDLRVPITETLGAEPIHWSLSGGCIGVSYDPSLEALRGDITTALEAWQGISCSSLCFTDPLATTIVPEPNGLERVIHIAPPERLGPREPALEGTIVHFLDKNGQILNAAIAAPVSEPPSTLELAGHIGHALGLSRPKPGVTSLLAPETIGDGPVAPTADDVASFCTLYGETPLCTP